MSWDVSLEISAGQARVCAWESNMTYNISPMLHKAGLDISGMDGWPAPNVQAACDAAYKIMDENPNPYMRLEPANGWGSYDGAMRWLAEISRQCEKYNLTVFRVC